MIVKCSHCRSMFPDSEFERHTCEKELIECKNIQVTEIIDGSYGIKKLVNGWGIDGILYTFEVVPRKAIPIIEPLNRRNVTDPFKRDGANGEVTEPEKTLTLSTKKKGSANREGLF